MAVGEDIPESSREEVEPVATAGWNRIIRILAYLAMAAVGLILMAIIAYYVARTAVSRQYREVDSVALVKPPPPTENFNFVDDFRVNTTDRDEFHFIKARLSLGFEPGNPALSAELAQRVPQLRNIINLILMSKSRQEFSTVQDRLDLQQEIRASINHILVNGKISEVYFNELIIN